MTLYSEVREADWERRLRDIAKQEREVRLATFTPVPRPLVGIAQKRNSLLL
jgi:hypothetical protein